MQTRTTPLRPNRLYWVWFVPATLLIILIVPALPPPYGGDGDVLSGAVGGLWAFAFYMHSRHAENARFMKELLSDFNGRYNQLNDHLQRALWHDGPFGPEARLKFIDYFNLCAEEWLFRQAGYIYDPVWTSWENGMRRYAKDPRVAELWEREKAEGWSYYGFELPLPDQASGGGMPPSFP